MTGRAGPGTQTTAQERGRKLALVVLLLAAWGVGRFALGMEWFSAILFSVALAYLGDTVLAYWRYRRKIVAILGAATSSEEVFRLLKDPDPDSALLDTYVPPLTFAFLAAEIYGVDVLLRNSEAPLNLALLGGCALMVAIPAGLVGGLVYWVMANIVPRWFDTLALARSSDREVCREAVARWEAWLAHLAKVQLEQQIFTKRIATLVSALVRSYSGGEEGYRDDGILSEWAGAKDELVAAGPVVVPEVVRGLVRVFEHSSTPESTMAWMYLTGVLRKIGSDATVELRRAVTGLPERTPAPYQSAGQYVRGRLELLLAEWRIAEQETQSDRASN